mmetsp:Transcript_359/g.475  ORF Transcript_359/g.475 Transcript_359/m.475 type:complete len:566 (+) Transcript_359:604-2301(+)
MSNLLVDFEWEDFKGVKHKVSLSPPAALLEGHPPPSSDPPSSDSDPSPPTSSSSLSSSSSSSSSSLSSISEATEVSQEEIVPKRLFSNTNIRKALALIKFVDLQEAYMTDDHDDDDDDDTENGFRFGGFGGGGGFGGFGGGYRPPWSQQQRQQQEHEPESEYEKNEKKLKKLKEKSEKSIKWAKQCYQGKLELEYELISCNDKSIFTSNQIFINTLQQIYDLEMKEYENSKILIDELEREILQNNNLISMISNLENNNNSNNNENDNTSNNISNSQTSSHPNEFLCPITMELMIEPVVASDGYTYEKDAILKWLKSNQTSPKTNLILTNSAIVPNRTLRSAIGDYVAFRSKLAVMNPVIFKDNQGDEIKYEIINDTKFEMKNKQKQTKNHSKKRKQNSKNTSTSKTTLFSSSLFIQQSINSKVAMEQVKWISWDSVHKTLSDTQGFVQLHKDYFINDDADESLSSSSSSPSSSSSSSSSSSCSLNIINELKEMVNLTSTCEWIEKKNENMVISSDEDLSVESMSKRSCIDETNSSIPILSSSSSDRQTSKEVTPQSSFNFNCTIC